LTDVRREGLRKIDRTCVDIFAREWLADYPDAKGLKRSTRVRPVKVGQVRELLLRNADFRP
jgi:hypothetical protein